ncbi:MAG: TolC family protein [Spirosomataceae bacterium]
MRRFLLLLLPIVSMAQEKWSLQECVQLGITNNLTVQQNQLLAKQSQILHTQSRLSVLPNTSASISQGANWGRSIDPTTNQFVTQQLEFQSVDMGASLNVFSGFSTQNTIKQNALLTQATQQDIQQAKDQLTLNITLAYLQVLSNEDLLEITRKQAEVTRQQIERTQSLVEIGSLSPNNLIDLKSQLANDELSITSATNTLKIARLQLVQLMNVPYKGDFQLERNNLDQQAVRSLEVSAEQIFGQAQSRFAAVKAADLRIQGADKGLLAAKGRMYPTLTLNGYLSTRYSNTSVLEYNKQLEANLFKYVSLDIRIPIFNGFQNRARWQTAVISKQLAEVSSQNTRMQLRQGVETAHVNAEVSLERYRAVEKQVLALEETFQSVENRYNAGLLNVFDYNVAKTNLDRARQNLIQSRYEYYYRTKVLDFYQGRSITEP